MKHDNRFIVNRIILLLLITVLILSLAACGSSSDSPAVSSKDYNYKLEDSDIRTDSESGISYVSNMVIVYFSENASQQVIDDVIRDLNGEVVFERRRGLEWLICDTADWHDISLHT